MNLFHILLLIQSTNGYIFYNKKYTKFPRHIIKNTKIHRDIKKISSNVAVDLATIWYNEIKTNCTNMNILYSHQSPSEQIYQYTNFMYDMSHDYNLENEFLIWKPKIKPILLNNRSSSAIVYPSYKETLGIVCYTNDKNKIIINDYMLSPFLTDNDNIHTNKFLKGVIIEYFINYLKYTSICFKM